MRTHTGWMLVAAAATALVVAAMRGRRRRAARRIDAGTVSTGWLAQFREERSE